MSTFIGSFTFTWGVVNDGTGYYLTKDIIIVDLWRRDGDRTNSSFVVPVSANQQGQTYCT